MIGYWTVMAAVLPIFIIMATGALMRRLSWLTEEADQSLMRLTINLLIPALILHSLHGNEALDDVRNILVAPATGFLAITVGLGIAWLAAPIFGVVETARRRTFAFTISIYNYGYIPIPLTMLLFDRETLGVLFLHMFGIEMAIWTISIAVLRGGLRGRGIRGFISAPVMAVFLGIAIHYTGATPFIPGFLVETIELLGSAAIPLSILLIGATVADNIAEFDPTRGLSTVLGACLLRLVLLALMLLAAARYLPVSQELRRVLVLEGAMPAAVFPLVMAKHYGGHVPTALRVIVWTGILSLLTIPFWIKLGMAWIGE